MTWIYVMYAVGWILTGIILTAYFVSIKNDYKKEKANG